MPITVSESDPIRPVVSSVNVVRDEPRLKIVRVVCHVKWPHILNGIDEIWLSGTEERGDGHRMCRLSLALPELPPNPPPVACSLPPDHPINTHPEWWTMRAYSSDKYDVLIVAVPVTDYCGGREVYSNRG